MVGKKSGKALLREEGLERTDNSMGLTCWPEVNPINQKNYYTEFLKRDDQILPYRLQQEERRNRMTTNAKNRDRELAQVGLGDAIHIDQDIDLGDDLGLDDSNMPAQERLGSKIIVIHPGSQNLRIGLANDSLPRTVPMCIARRWAKNEAEDGNGEPKPKREKASNGLIASPEKMFAPSVSSSTRRCLLSLIGLQFASEYTAMSAELKTYMRSNKQRVLPNSKELVVNYNKRIEYETISEHNDPLRIDWTEILPDPQKAPSFFTGKEALRIPDYSEPRYKLFWPLQHGQYNEKEYDQKLHLFNDVTVIIEEEIKTSLGLRRKRDWAQYSCVFVVPDLYEREYVTQSFEMAMQDLGFGKVAFIQESLAASYGAGYTSTCVVDIGAQKTSICCVDDGMCVEDSRINIKYGGADVTETFLKMMLFDHFPYEEINLKRRYDFLLAEEIKCQYCNLKVEDVTVQPAEFHLRAPQQETRKYTFKFYDEKFLAPRGYFQPEIFDNASKLEGRRKIIGPSINIYSGLPDDPTSSAQSAIIHASVQLSGQYSTNGDGSNGQFPSTPLRQAPGLVQRLNEPLDRSSPAAHSAAGEDEDDTPAPFADGVSKSTQNILSSAFRDEVLPVAPLDYAIITSITYGARNDDRKMRDYLGGIMIIGGGSQIPMLDFFLEEALKKIRPTHTKDIQVGARPRDLDPQVVVWKGASVFGRIPSTDDLWIGRLEYDRLGSRVLNNKVNWIW